MGEAVGSNGRHGRTGPEQVPDHLGALLHDLRNPLAPLRNAAELLRTLCDDPRQLQCVDVISRQIVALTRTLDDVSVLADSRRRPLQLIKQTLDVSTVVEPVLRAIRPMIDQRRQNLFVALPTEPVLMECDPLRLAQVIQTLLDNASRMTPEGGSIALRAQPHDSQLLLEVSDDGIGMAAEELASLFNVFEAHFPAAEPPPLAGSGLSLALSRNIIEVHGGTIEAFSDGAGRGSRFVVRLPLSEPTLSAEPALSLSRRAHRILVIDDHEDSAASLAELLASAGHSVLTARTGEQGLALAEAFEPQAVVIDIGLPGIDGFEVGRRMREMTVTRDALLIAVTGFGLKQFRDLSAYSVFRHYLLKPASPVTLLHVIERTLSESAA